jgi:uncharacterized protein YkwD
MNLYKQLLLIGTLFIYCVSYAQTPPNLTADMNPGSYTAYNSSLSIAANFNAGRRFEETNLGLAANSLGSMVLPSNYSSMTLAQKTLFIVNSERACRNGINYGSGVLTVKPLYGVESNLSNVAQLHANYLMSSNTFDHCGDPAYGTTCSGKSTPAQRVNGNATIANGQESTGENIGYSVSSSAAATFPILNEQIIFDMMYQDAGSLWGHRVNFIKAYTDNYGASGNEAFIGVAEKLSTSGYQGWASGKVIVYVLYDPKSTATNAFSFDAILPVDLLSFEAKTNEKSVDLVWTSAGEENFEGYQVEKSTDGLSFEKIGFVTPKPKSNTPKLTYNFNDPSVQLGHVYYYRLRLVDLDGKFRYSPTRSVIMDALDKKVHAVAYNTITRELTLENLTLNKQNWQMTLVDVSARVVWKQQIALNERERQVFPLEYIQQAGIYFVNLTNAQRTQTTKIFVGY